MITNYNDDFFEIQSNRLKLSIANENMYAKRTRFSHCGYIIQAKLDKKHTLCTRESIVFGNDTGGEGICGEFLTDAEIYNKTQIGDWFPKIGVGYLKKVKNEPFSPFFDYDCKKSEITQKIYENKVEYINELPMYNDFACKLYKTITVIENEILIDYKLENTGKIDIKSSEYAHNFFGFNNAPIDENYEIILPKGFVDKHTGCIKLSDAFIANFDGIVEDSFFLYIENLEKTSPSFKMTHKKLGLSISEYNDFSPEHIAFWGRFYTASVEVFNDIFVKPNENQTWQRKYVFEAK